MPCWNPLRVIPLYRKVACQMMTLTCEDATSIQFSLHDEKQMYTITTIGQMLSIYGM